MTCHMTKWIMSPASTTFVNASCRKGQRLTSRRARFIRASHYYTIQILNPKPYISNPTQVTWHRTHYSGLKLLHHLNPEPWTLNPQKYILNPTRVTWRRIH